MDDTGVVLQALKWSVVVAGIAGVVTGLVVATSADLPEPRANARASVAAATVGTFAAVVFCVAYLRRRRAATRAVIAGALLAFGGCAGTGTAWIGSNDGFVELRGEADGAGRDTAPSGSTQAPNAPASPDRITEPAEDEPVLLASCTSDTGPLGEEGQPVAGAPGMDIRTVEVSETSSAAWNISFHLHEPVPRSAADHPSGLFWSVHLADADNRIQVGAALDRTDFSVELSELTGQFSTETLPPPTVDGNTISFELPGYMLDFEPTHFYAVSEYLDETSGSPEFVHDTCPSMADWFPSQPEDMPRFKKDATPVDQEGSPSAATPEGDDVLAGLRASWLSMDASEQELLCDMADSMGLEAAHQALFAEWDGPTNQRPPSRKEWAALIDEQC